MRLYEVLNLTHSNIRISTSGHISIYNGDIKTLKSSDLYKEIWKLEVISITTNDTNNIGIISILIRAI